MIWLFNFQGVQIFVDYASITVYSYRCVKYIANLYIKCWVTVMQSLYIYIPWTALLEQSHSTKMPISWLRLSLICSKFYWSFLPALPKKFTHLLCTLDSIWVQVHVFTQFLLTITLNDYVHTLYNTPPHENKIVGGN